MLTRLYIDNYRCVSNFEWKPAKIVVLAGRNGGGKSVLVDVIRRVAGRVLGLTFTKDLFSPASLTRWQSRMTQTFELEFTAKGRTYGYRLVVEQSADPDAEPFVTEEVLGVDSAIVFQLRDRSLSVANAEGKLNGTVPISDTAVSPLSFTHHPAVAAFRDVVRDCWCVAPMPRPRHEDTERPARQPSFTLSNFISWYRAVSGDFQTVERITARLRETIPGFRALKFDPTTRRPDALTVIMSPGEGRRGEPEFSFVFSELSDGEQMLVMLSTLTEAAPLDAGTLVLDEPDNFLGLLEVQPWLRSLEDRIDATDGQIIIASHHPEILNRLWRSHGYLLSREPFGPVRIQRAREVTDLTPAELFARGWEAESTT